MAILLLFAGLFNDTAVSIGFYRFIYVFEYAYMGMVLLMTYSLSDAVVRAASMEGALRESEERYRSVITASPDSIALTDLQGNIILCNQQTAMLHGFERAKEVVRTNVWDRVAPEDRERVAEKLCQTIETGSVREVQSKRAAVRSQPTRDRPAQTG
jgi:PAS domain S-box-containing protein